MHRVAWVVLAVFAGDRPRILPTSADPADEINEQDKVDLACLGLDFNVLPPPRTQVLPWPVLCCTLSLSVRLPVHPVTFLALLANYLGCACAAAHSLFSPTIRKSPFSQSNTALLLPPTRNHLSPSLQSNPSSPPSYHVTYLRRLSLDWLSPYDFFPKCGLFCRQLHVRSATTGSPPPPLPLITL